MEKVDLRYNNPSNWTMFGPRISQERAHIILPMLIERATEGQTITFGELAEFNIAWAMAIRPSIICITGTLYLLERNQLPEAQFTWTHGRIPRIANMCFTGTFQVRNRGVFMLGVSTGGRISELLSLQIGDVYQNGKPVTDMLFEKAIVKGGEVSRAVSVNADGRLAECRRQTRY